VARVNPIPAWIEPEVSARLGSVPARPSWPRVSIVVPTLDGRALLERLLAGLGATTEYDGFDVLVVDNGSADGTVDWLRSAALPFPLRVVAMERNLSFSEACNAGAAATDGELLLFLNNDVEPIESGWLKRLVTSLEDSGAAVAGAVLLDPALESEGGRQGAVHHRDLYFRPAPRLQGVLEPRPRGFGVDLATALGPDRPAAAVTAACVLVRRSAFDSVQGFSEAFFYGKEDVDLCLKLAAAGHGVVASGATVLVHHRGATRRASRFGTAEARRDNLRVLIERWGPRLRREYTLDHESGRGVWSDGSATSERGGESVAYCVVGDPEDAKALAGGLRELGREARTSTDGLGWLLDDVIVHVDSSASPPPAVPGRWNVLARKGGPKLPRREMVRFGVVSEHGNDAGRLAAEVEAEMERRGGAPRVRPGAPPRAAPPRAILVLGMARTGTSATTRLLDLCGVEVGPEANLMPPNPDVNAKGFYEHFPLMQINVALLRRLGGTWREPPALRPGWELDPTFDDLREEARRLIAEDFAGARVWTFKDPRTSLTLPFWRPLLGDVDYIVCHRQPLDVAASLERRDGLALEQSLALWERYMAASILQTVGARRLFIGYDEYFEGRDGALAALTAFAGAPGLAEDEGFRAQAASWLDVDMRHHHRTHRELLAEPQAGERVARLHLLLELAVRSREREPALAGARGGGPISDALDAAARDSLRTAAVPPLSVTDRPA
jgi:GT2 family glycosyltransferase